MKTQMQSPAAEPARRSYDRLAPDYDRRWKFYVDATLRAVMETARFEGSERVLDLACGTGALEMRLLEQWPELRMVGVDVSLGMLRQAAGKDHGG